MFSHNIVKELALWGLADDHVTCLAGSSAEEIRSEEGEEEGSGER